MSLSSCFLNQQILAFEIEGNALGTSNIFHKMAELVLQMWELTFLTIGHRNQET